MSAHPPKGREDAPAELEGASKPEAASESKVVPEPEAAGAEGASESKAVPEPEAAGAEGASESKVVPEPEAAGASESKAVPEPEAGAAAQAGEPELVVLVPLYRERRRLPRTLEQLCDFCAEHRAELLLVDGDSDDGTGDWIRQQAAARPQVHALDAPRGGKGLNQRLGLRRALELAPRANVLLTDCDLSTPLARYADLLAAVERGADLAFGSRAARDADVVRPQGWLKRWLGRQGNLLVRLLLRLPYRDTQCGFRLLTPRAARLVAGQCRCRGAGLDFESLALARRAGLSLREVGVEWRNDQDSRFGAGAYLRALAELAGVALRLLRRPSG